VRARRLLERPKAKGKREEEPKGRTEDVTIKARGRKLKLNPRMRVLPFSFCLPFTEV
jgi:hypothetical protein